MAFVQERGNNMQNDLFKHNTEGMFEYQREGELLQVKLPFGTKEKIKQITDETFSEYITRLVLEDIARSPVKNRSKESDAEARKRAYKTGKIKDSDLQRLKNKFVGRNCPICGVEMNNQFRPSQPSIQHDKPISKGGKHVIKNISVICLGCNASIRNKEISISNNEEVIEVWEEIMKKGTNVYPNIR